MDYNDNNEKISEIMFNFIMERLIAFDRLIDKERQFHCCWGSYLYHSIIWFATKDILKNFSIKFKEQN